MKPFNLARMIVTNTGLPNFANREEVQKLEWLWNNFVSPIEDMIGEIDITSAFRSEEVNKAVGGVPTSQHRLAEAVDWIPKEVLLEDAFSWCKSSLEFGQLIIEDSKGKQWIHISRPRIGKTNQQAMRMKDGKYTIV